MPKSNRDYYTLLFSSPAPGLQIHAQDCLELALLSAINTMPQATEITRWSKASDVRDALARETRIDRWRQGRWWREFLVIN